MATQRHKSDWGDNLEGQNSAPCNAIDCNILCYASGAVFILELADISHFLSANQNLLNLFVKHVRDRR